MTKGSLPTRRQAAGIIYFLLLLLAALGLTGTGDTARLTRLVQTTQPGLYSVEVVYDGDTIGVNIDGRTEKVRLIGVDTPEKNHPQKPVQCFAERAAEFTATLIGSRRVRLEADPVNQNRDRYGRLLRYVYLDDGTEINAEIIAQGYGFAYLSFPFIKAENYRRLEAGAREQSLGLWRACEVELNDGFISTNPV